MDSAPRNDVPFDMFPSAKPPTLEPEVSEEKPQFGFTMKDVCQELEDLKNQMRSTSSTSNKRRKCANRARYGKFNGTELDEQAESSTSREYTLPNPGTSFDPWTFFNREIAFILFNRSLRSTNDNGVIQMARDEIGLRIAHHKTKSEQNGNRIHVFYKNKLNELQNDIDRQKALVLIYVLQKLRQEDIEALERRLFPIPPKLLLGLA